MSPTVDLLCDRRDFPAPLNNGASFARLQDGTLQLTCACEPSVPPRNRAHERLRLLLAQGLSKLLEGRESLCLPRCRRITWQQTRRKCRTVSLSFRAITDSGRRGEAAV